MKGQLQHEHKKQKQCDPEQSYLYEFGIGPKLCFDIEGPKDVFALSIPKRPLILFKQGDG